MPNPLGISDAGSLGLHAMAYLARNQGIMISIHQIATELGVSEHHLAKVCRMLSKAGLIEAARGPKGGLRLKRPAGEIALLDIYETIQGPLDPPACLLDRPACGSDRCILGGLLESVNRQVLDYVSKTTLADLTETTEH